MKTIVIYTNKTGDINGFNFQHVDKTPEEVREVVKNQFEKTIWMKQYNTFKVFEISDFHYDFIQYCLQDRYDNRGNHLDKPESIKLEEAHKRIDELEDNNDFCLRELKEIKEKITYIIDNIKETEF